MAQGVRTGIALTMGQNHPAPHRRDAVGTARIAKGTTIRLLALLAHQVSIGTALRALALVMRVRKQVAPGTAQATIATCPLHTFARRGLNGLAVTAYMPKGHTAKATWPAPSGHFFLSSGCSAIVLMGRFV